MEKQTAGKSGNESVKVLHTADVHLGTTFSSFPDAEKREVLQTEHVRLLSRLEQVVKSEAVHLVLIAGDLFDEPFPEKRWLERARASFAEMAPAEVVICAGNHDPYFEHSFWSEPWPTNVHIAKPGVTHRFIFRRLHTVVDSASFDDVYADDPLFPGKPLEITEVDRTESADDSASVTHGQGGADPDGRPALGRYNKILMLHGELMRSAGESRYNPISEADLRAMDYDYVALGHIHLPSEGQFGSRGARWAYPGAPQGRGFDEPGERGFRIGTLAPRTSEVGACLQSWETVSSGARPFVVTSLDISSCETEKEIERAIESHLRGRRDAARALYRVILAGSPDLEYAIDVKYLAHELASSGFFYVELRDETRVAVDWERMGRQTGFGSMLKEIYDEEKGKSRKPEDRERLDRAIDLIMRAYERTANEN